MNRLLAAIAAATIIAVLSCSCQPDQPTEVAACGFTKVTTSSVGRPSSVKPHLIALSLACCDGDFCVWVDKFSQCNFPNEVFYCTVGQTNIDGTITCYD